MGRDTVQLETAVNTISHEYLLEFTSEYGIPETLHPELPGPEDRIVDFPEGKVGGGCHSAKGRGGILPNVIPNHWTLSKTGTIAVDERVFPTVMDWRMNVPKDGMPAERTYSIEAVRALDTHRTPIQKQPEMLLCLVGISRRYYLGDDLYPTFLHDDDRDMDLFNLFRALNPTKVKTGSRPRALHEVPLLTLTATRVIKMDEPAAATDSSGVPSIIERSPLYFFLKVGASDQGTIAPEMPSELPRGKSLAAIQLGLASTVFVPEDTPIGVSDPDPLSVADPPSRHPADIAQSSQGTAAAGDPESENASSPIEVGSPESVYRSSQGTAAAGDPESENASSPVEVGSPESVYRPEWGVVNGSLLDTPEACQDLVDHVAPPGYFSELRHQHNDEFLRRYNINLARQVAMGSQMRLRFEQEAKLLRKSVAQVARRDKKIQALELEIKNLKALLEAETNTKKAAEDRSAGLSQELENIRAQFSDLRSLSGSKTTGWSSMCRDGCTPGCAEHRFREEFYPHMLTAIAGRRWVIGRGLRLTVMKCGESLELRQAFADVALKDLKYPLVDQLESLNDAPMDVIMDALYLESDTGDDAPQDIRDLHPSSSQLTIPMYPEVRDPRNPWACKEEMVLADAIAANISRAEKKKKCRIVCRTHGVGSAHHARSDGVLVSAPTMVPQGLALLLADASTQTEPENDT
uniref:Transposase (Putative), gypsy type n=1 Tax=Tanacetum cinerariifolium TaxID=118510 RepID=A0A6L2K427_TANCI|nr:hypothetical protein [Tanacetum cinerariifolium]